VVKLQTGSIPRTTEIEFAPVDRGTWAGTSQWLGRHERTHAAHQGPTKLQHRHSMAGRMRPIAHPRPTTSPFFLTTPLAFLPNEKQSHSHHPQRAGPPHLCGPINCILHSLDSTGRLCPSYANLPWVVVRAAFSFQRFLSALRSSPSRHARRFFAWLSIRIVHRRHQTHLHAFGERHCRASPAVQRFGTIAPAVAPALELSRRKVWTFFPLQDDEDYTTVIVVQLHLTHVLGSTATITSPMLWVHGPVNWSGAAGSSTKQSTQKAFSNFSVRLLEILSKHDRNFLLAIVSGSCR
jgi:hypothetical protein